MLLVVVVVVVVVAAVVVVVVVVAAVELTRWQSTSEGNFGQFPSDFGQWRKQMSTDHSPT